MAFRLSGKLEIDPAEMLKIVDDWFQKHYGHPVKGVEYDKKSGKLVALFDYETEQLEKQTTDLTVTGKHSWPGLYASIGEVLDSQRARRKKFITYEDLLAELHDMEDNRGNKLFVKTDGTKLPMGVLRHRLAPSQIVRQAKGQANLKNVKNDRKNGGLSFT